MPNWCGNKVVVTGPVEEIARFTQTCIRLDEDGTSCFDFNSLIPMPAILKDTVAGGLVDDALLVLGRDDLVWIPNSLEERMKYWEVSDIEALKEKIGLEALETARRSIEAFEQTGTPNWYVWANRNWGTKWNACDFEVVADEPGRYEFTFETAWAPPIPVLVKMGEMFSALDFDLSGSEPGMEFAFEGTIRAGKLELTELDPAPLFGRGRVRWPSAGRGYVAEDNAGKELGEFQTKQEAWDFLDRPEIAEKLMAQYRAMRAGETTMTNETEAMDKIDTPRADQIKEIWQLQNWGDDEFAEQVMAELSFAKAMNVQYVPEHHKPEGNVAGYRVRRAPNGMVLVLVPSDSDEDIFVAVRVERTKGRACVLGWLRGSEGKLPQFHQKNCWVIPPEVLHDMEKLPGMDRLRAMPPWQEEA
jgi:Api92-like protein with ferredoxin domain